MSVSVRETSLQVVSGETLSLALFASNDNAEGRALTESAMQFLYELRNADGVVVPSSAKRFIERICLSMPRSYGGPLLHNRFGNSHDRSDRQRTPRANPADDGLVAMALIVGFFLRC